MDGIDKSVLQKCSKFNFIGVPIPPDYRLKGPGVLASAVNKACRKHKIDAIITLMDVNQWLFDAAIVPFTILWHNINLDYVDFIFMHEFSL